MRHLLIAAGTLLATGIAAHAQSIYGPGGLLLNPTADFAPKGNISPAALWIPTKDPGGATRSLYSIGANYAATDKLEVGVSYLKLAPGGSKPDGSFGGFAKYKLATGRGGWSPDIAAGAGFLAGGDLDARTAFLAARFTPLPTETKHPFHLHAGVLYADRLYGGKRDDAALYVGADVALTPQLAAFAEYRQKLGLESGSGGEPDRHAPNAIGLIFKPAEDYKLVVAYANNGPSTDNRLAIGVGFTLGSRRTTGGR